MIGITLAAALLTATPETLDYRLKTARGGDTIALSGVFRGRVVFPPGRIHSPPLVIDASKASVLAGGTFQDVDGIIWRGGSAGARAGVEIPGVSGYVFLVQGARHITIDGVKFVAGNKGAVIKGSSDVTISRSSLVGLAVDGINSARSARVAIRDNIIGPFLPPFETPNGRVHQDGIQWWMGNTDFSFTGNTVRGTFQGIADWGPREGNLLNERGVIADNIVQVGFGQAITTMSSVGVMVRDNKVLTGDPPGKHPSTIRFRKDDPTTIACGNIVEDRPNGRGTSPCAKAR